MTPEEKQKAVQYALYAANFAWTPKGEGMVAPNSPFAYTKDQEYTGLPYSSTKFVGRTIGEDIFFDTFLAALENPESVLYTEDLSDYGSLNPQNATTYYGVVCSKLTTTFGWMCGVAYLSRFHHTEGYGDPDPRKSSVTIHALDGTGYDADVSPPEVGDLMWYLGHTRIVTNVKKNNAGGVVSITIAESVRNTAKTVTMSKSTFEGLLNQTGGTEWGLVRFVNLPEWRGENVPWYFPDFRGAYRSMNSVVLLNRGDWVPYYNTEPVKFNILDADAETLVIQRHATSGIYEQRIPISGTGVITKWLPDIGQYTSYCIMADGSLSQKNEFAICSTSITVTGTALDEDIIVSWEVENLIPRFIFIRCLGDITKRYYFFLDGDDRAAGQYTIPANTIQQDGSAWFYVVSENPLGRLAALDNGITLTAS